MSEVFVPVKFEVNVSKELVLVATFIVDHYYVQLNEENQRIFTPEIQKELDAAVSALNKTFNMKGDSLPATQEMALIATDFSFLNSYYQALLEKLVKNVVLFNEIELVSMEVVGVSEAYVNLDVVRRIRQLAEKSEHFVSESVLSLFQTFDGYQIKERAQTMLAYRPESLTMKQVLATHAGEFELMLKDIGVRIRCMVEEKKERYRRINALKLTDEAFRELPEVFQELVLEAKEYKKS